MEQPELKLDSEMMCVCGDTASQHVDGCEQCFIPECGCKEFEEVEAEQEADADMPKCPQCGLVLKEIWDNSGWDGFEGPRNDEVVGYECSIHGQVDPRPEVDTDAVNETFMENGKEALMEEGMSADEAEASVREQVGIVD
jgi:hypothetical protein